MNKTFEYANEKYISMLISKIDPKIFEIEFCQLISIVSKILLYFQFERNDGVDEVYDFSYGKINIEKKHTTLFSHIYENWGHHLTIEFYMSENFPFIYSNLYDNSFQKYADYAKFRRQFLLTYCPKIVDKKMYKNTFAFKKNVVLNSDRHLLGLPVKEYNLILTDWQGQKISSYAQFGSADQFQKKLTTLFEETNFITELKTILERVAFNMIG